MLSPGSERARTAFGRISRFVDSREAIAVLFVLLTVVYCLTASYDEQNADTESTYLPAWQLGRFGNVTLDAFASRDDLWLVDSDGRTVSNRFPGAVWLATPFYWLSRANVPTATVGNLVAATATAIACCVLLLLLRRVVDGRLALGAVLLVALGTPTWTVSADALWTHGPGQLWLLLGLLLFAARRPGLAGLAFGAAITTRPHYAVVPALIGVLDVARHRRLSPAVRTAVGSAVGLGLLVLYDVRVFGAVLPGGYEYGALTPDLAGAVSLLERLAGTSFSRSRGLVFAAPFLLLLLPGLPAAWRRAPDWVRSAALAGSAYMLVQLAFNRWSGGSGFYSYRLPIEWLTLSTPLLVLAYEDWTALRPERRRAFSVLAGWAVVSHALGAVLFDATGQQPNAWVAWDFGRTVAERPVASALVLLLAAGAFAAATRCLRADRDRLSPARTA